MGRAMQFKEFTLSKLLLLIITSTITLTFISLYAEAEEQSPQQQIQTLISTIYDKPNLKVETSPIVIVDEYAVADWVQGERGGRALLQRIKGKWAIMACGANGLKDVKTLTEAGIPRPTAESIVSKLTNEEKAIDAHRLHLFSLFGTKDDPMQMDRHEHHNH